MNSSRETVTKQDGLTRVRINAKGADDKWFSSKVKIHHSVDEVSTEDWNGLVPKDSPILRHQFLSALEKTGCVSPKTGWEPHHLAVYTDHELLAAAPCYLKYHSYGEYIFDWDWATAYQQAGLNYYPKILLAIPFTPITSKRLLIHPTVDTQSAGNALINAVLYLAKTVSASSVHSLFTTPLDNTIMKTVDFVFRHNNQFHWHNERYQSFNDFLYSLNSKRRKNIVRERKTITARNVRFRWLSGRESTRDDWTFFYMCYKTTLAEHNSIPYLNESFFQSLAQTMPDDIRLLIANRDGRDIASAFFLAGQNSLYGRYWGTTDPISNLHFETCYYQPIEYCILNRLNRFEAGAQGEHKLNRGLIPTSVSSMHWLSNPEFLTAIKRYTAEESKYVKNYQTILKEHSPYRKKN